MKIRAAVPEVISCKTDKQTETHGIVRVWFTERKQLGKVISG